VQDPQIQLQALGLTVPDALHPDSAAVLDTAHRSFVNYETKQRFRPGSDSPRGSFGGRPYLFFTAANKETFEKSPEAFALPNYDKIEIPGMP
jgi:hypothetical protein